MAAAVRTYYYQQGGEGSPSQTKSWPTSCVTALTASSRRRPGHSHRSSKCQGTSLTRGPWLHFVALCSRAGGQHPTDVTAAAVTAVAAQLPEPLRTLAAPCLLVLLERRWQCFLSDVPHIKVETLLTVQVVQELLTGGLCRP